MRMNTASWRCLDTVELDCGLNADCVLCNAFAEGDLDESASEGAFDNVAFGSSKHSSASN